MYKRINKRIRRKEKEEALGLDGETKEMLGIPETDSDESDSSDEEQSDGGSEEAGVDDGAKPGTRRGRGLKQLSESGGSDIVNLSGTEAEDSEEENEDEEMVGNVDEGEPPMSISEALKNPLYSIKKGSEAQWCILCPGKELKHAKMASVHVESSSHLRRSKRFTALATRVGDEDEDPRLLVAALDESVRIVPREKATKVSDGPRIPKKERLVAKRERRRERRAVRQAGEQAQEKPANEAQPNTKSDRVLGKKILNRHSEAITKHKAKSKHPRLHNSSTAKNSVV